MAKKSKAVEAPTVEEIHSIKGFDLDWKCRDFQFEIGKTYEHEGDVSATNAGFHAIEGYPLEVFDYYAPGLSRYAEVTQSGAISRHSCYSKVASAKITIGVELHIHDLVQRAVKWVVSKCDDSKSQHATGDYSASSATGHRSASSATGHRSASSATGNYSAAMASGKLGKVMGKTGNALFLVYRDDDYNIVHAWAGIVGRDGIKEGVWYLLNADGKPEETS